MSDWTVSLVPCPACGAEEERTLFSSVNGLLLPQAVEGIAAGTFERFECGCGHVFQPEHRMLLSHLPLGEWLVMHPWREHIHFAQHETDVRQVFGREFGQPPEAIAPQVEQVRPRVVFGQCMLAEAVRLIGMGLDAAAVECAKLLWVRRNLSALLNFGPSLLCLEEPTFDGFAFSVRALDDGRIVGAVNLARDAIAEVLATRSQLRILAPRLFDRPYVSATRYLYPSS